MCRVGCPGDSLILFSTLPLGQTCFSSVCCTPALKAAAAAPAQRQTMGCCAPVAISCFLHLRRHLFPPPLPVAHTFCYFSPHYLSLPSSFSYHFLPPTRHLALLPFGHATLPPPLNQGILDAQRKRRGRGSGRIRPPRRNLEGRPGVGGGPLSFLLSYTLHLYLPSEKLQPLSPSTALLLLPV